MKNESFHSLDEKLSKSALRFAFSERETRSALVELRCFGDHTVERARRVEKSSDCTALCVTLRCATPSRRTRKCVSSLPLQRNTFHSNEVPGMGGFENLAPGSFLPTIVRPGGPTMMPRIFVWTTMVKTLAMGAFIKRNVFLVYRFSNGGGSFQKNVYACSVWTFAGHIMGATSWGHLGPRQ